MPPASRFRVQWLTVLVSLLLLGGAVLFIWRGLALRDAAPMTERVWVGSQACADCHEDRHASWYRTYHRTMTQDANATSVLGVFDGRVLQADGTVLRPVQQSGKYAFEYLDPQTGAVVGRADIVRTVGSHRYQQYLARAGGGSNNDYRLEFLWHIGEQRWVPLNAAFLHPDGLPGDHSVSLWNQNCIFCHNTGPAPGIQNYAELAQRARSGQRIDINTEARYDSSVAELGIGCEACHGPGSVHLERTASAVDRLLLQFMPGADPAIVQAEHLPADRSAQVCAQCHAQRLPASGRSMLTWLETGPTYRAGDDLDAHVAVVRAETPSPDPSNPDLYRLRFWADGSPRLSAYEWQGLSQSDCFAAGQLSCLNCHAMHAGDPAGMMTERQRTDAPCLACHQQFRGESAQAHTRHAPGSAGSACQSCHMPYQVYGVMSIQRTHQISTPDLARNLSSGAPNACSACHVEQSPKWVQAQLMEGWTAESGSRELPPRVDGAPLQRADALAGLLAGDAAQQAVWAQRIGAADSEIAASRRAVLIPALLIALEQRYPSTRRFAWRSLRALARELDAVDLDLALADFDYAGPAASRAAQLASIHAAWLRVDKSDWKPPMPDAHCVRADWSTDTECMAELLALGARADRQISIGE